MTTNLQDTGNLRSIAHKLFKKILKPFSAHYSAECERAAEQRENCRAGRKWRIRPTGFMTLCNQQLQSRRKSYLKVYLQWKHCLYTCKLYTVTSFLPLYSSFVFFLSWLKCSGFSFAGTRLPSIQFFLSKIGHSVGKVALKWTLNGTAQPPFAAITIPAVIRSRQHQ